MFTERQHNNDIKSHKDNNFWNQMSLSDGVVIGIISSVSGIIITARIHSVWEDNVFTHVCLSVSSTLGGGGPM